MPMTHLKAFIIYILHAIKVKVVTQSQLEASTHAIGKLAHLCGHWFLYQGPVWEVRKTSPVSQDQELELFICSWKQNKNITEKLKYLFLSWVVHIFQNL